MLSHLLPLPLRCQNIPDGFIVPYYPLNIQFPTPNAPNSECTHLPATFAIVDIYLLVPPYPLLNTPALSHTPTLSSGTLGISTTLPAHPKNPICHPNEPQLPGIHPGLLFFFGGGISPICIDHV